MNQIDGLRFIQVLKPTSRHAERRTVVTLDMAVRLEFELTEGEIRKRARGQIPNEVWLT